MEVGWSSEFLMINKLTSSSVETGLSQFNGASAFQNLGVRLREMRKREHVWALLIGQKMKKSLITDSEGFTGNWRRKCYT